MTVEQSTPQSPFTIHAEYADRVNFAMQQNGVPLIDAIVLGNQTKSPIEDIELHISLENGDCEASTRHIARVDAGSTIRITPDDFTLNAARLRTRTEAERTELVAIANTADLSARVSFPVDLLAFDQWPGIGHMPELTAAFVTPNHPHVAALLAGARAILSMAGEPDALDGYQSGSRTRVARIAQACFLAARDQGIGYIDPPASFETTGQRVRMVDRIARENFGTCLDLSLLLASLWEQCGIHPVLLFPESHAMIAFWAHDAYLAEAAIDEPSRIRNLIELGELVAVEATLLTKPDASFDDAVRLATERMHEVAGGFCAVDIQAGRKRGVRPLPLRDGSIAEPSDSTISINAQSKPSGTDLDRLTLAERAEQVTATQLHDESNEPDDRIKRWQTRLLDLSLRNRLINFRETGRTLPLCVPELARFEDALAQENRFSIHSQPAIDDSFAAEELAANRVYTAVAETEAHKRLLTLYRTAKSSIEETGANLLHLSLGMLKWYETGSADRPRTAPLILLPLQLHRSATGSGYRFSLSLSDEPMRPNITLLEKLQTEFGIDTARLEDLPEDGAGLDVPLILRNFRSAIRDTKRWEVIESAHIGLFSFNKFLMWRDLRENLDGLKRNRLVRHLVESPEIAFDTDPFPDADQLDDTSPPDSLLCTRDADSSQLAAVRAAADGKTFVLEGPPGTGKSQTIANIVADSLARGKRVLFVAEKMAALSVVRRRLDRDGLGPFCLELHSAKARKKEVLAQLDEALSVTPVFEPLEWPALCDNLTQTRHRLNAYVRAMHEPRATGESLYQMLGRLSTLGDGPTVANPTQDTSSVHAQELDDWRRKIGALIDAAQPIDPPHEHPLREIGRSTWDFSLPAEAERAIKIGQTACEELGAAICKFVGLFDGELESHLLSRSGVESFSRLAGLLQDSPAPPRRLFDDPVAGSWRARAREALQIAQRCDAQKDALQARYRVEFLAIEPLPHLDALQRSRQQFWPLRSITGFLARRKLRMYARAQLPTTESLVTDLELVRSIRQAQAELNQYHDVIATIGADWVSRDWDKVASMLDWCEAFANEVGSLERDSPGSTLFTNLYDTVCSAHLSTDIGKAAKSLETCWASWTDSWAHIEDCLSIDRLVDAQTQHWIEYTADLLSRWAINLGELNNWCVWRASREEAVRAGLTDLVATYEDGSIARDDLRPVFERSFGQAWFTTTANQTEEVRSFNAESHHHAIERFRSLDKSMLQMARLVVTSKLHEAVPAIPESASRQSEVGILRRELEKKRRHLPTRRLIESIPNLLPRLKPCFLMSPLSVAQFLDTELPPFDLVIFDEASQIPVWDAIGAIARGKEVLVVGDSKQLPPTTFFSTIDDDDEIGSSDVYVEDMESILKECNASGIPAMRLRWHYRSRHESLIAFSNHHYYQNELHTFPSPAERSEALGVTFRHIAEGVYDRGGSRTNTIEAEAVVDHVVGLLLDPSTTDSIGVVTFSQAQQGLVEDLFDDRRRQQPEIERFFTDETEEPVFVKNLENVQGDERDTIIFSVGYGPDANGKQTMNFGPLNQEGGERRLNVAVTRARRRLMVFSSMKADQIDLRRTRAVGVRHFKTFLDYADRGPEALVDAVEAGTKRFEAGFEHAVWSALTERGWTVDMRVGYAGYRIDLAVRDPNNPDRYVLGIECDGAAYHSAKVARDRDRTRHAVLKGLGWRISRVWSTQWHINRDGCLAKLIADIELATQGTITDAPSVSQEPVAESNPPPILTDPVHSSAAPCDPTHVPPPLPGVPASSHMHPLEPSDHPTHTGGRTAYRVAQPTSRRLSSMDIYEQRTMRPATEALTEIVSVEGPIVKDLALRRMATWFGVQRLTGRYRQRFDEIEQAWLKSDQGSLIGGIYWGSDSSPAFYQSVRTPHDEASQRDIDEIPQLEIINGVAYVLEQQFGMPRDELVRQTASLFGFSRVTTRVGEAIHEAIDQAIATGRAVDAGDRITVTDR